jgi:hypothetical protein
MNAWEAELPSRRHTIEVTHGKMKPLVPLAQAMDPETMLVLKIRRHYSESVPIVAWLVADYVYNHTGIRLRYGCRPTQFVAYFWLEQSTRNDSSSPS